LKLIRFLQSAREDVRREKSYYRKISPELAQRFQSAVEVAVNSVANHPLAMQAFDDDIRRWPLEAFPHGILYRVEIEFVLILAIFHPKQLPYKWRDPVRT
jgi:plasmid stabilization system protein ParE